MVQPLKQLGHVVGNMPNGSSVSIVNLAVIPNLKKQLLKLRNETSHVYREKEMNELSHLAHITCKDLRSLPIFHVG